MSTSQSLAQPLKGDGNGHFRIQIVGNSGVGKSTLAAHLSTILHVPFLSLDAVFWLPGWKQADTETFRARVTQSMDDAEMKAGGWIIDGNYFKRAGGIVKERATDILWLDPPLLLYFPRLLLRTFLRLARVRPPCSEGCPERASETFFSRDSIIWWCLTQHRVARARERPRLASDTSGKYKRIGGWGSELRRWVGSVEALTKKV